MSSRDKITLKCVCVPILVTTSRSAVRNHCRTLPAPCVRPRVCSVFCVHMHSFAGLIRRTPPPTFSDTAITDRHSDTTIFQLRAHLVRISWSVGSEKSFGHVPRWESNPRLPACKASTLSTRPGSPQKKKNDTEIVYPPFKVPTLKTGMVLYKEDKLLCHSVLIS